MFLLVKNIKKVAKKLLTNIKNFARLELYK